MNKNISDKIKNLPNNPGCYKFYDKTGKIIYIGKAKNLKKRVSSYFFHKDLDLKSKVLIDKINDMSWEITDSEIEALVLESLLIKKYKPRFNVKIKDDKDFLYIRIDLKERFPYPQLIRRPPVGAGFKPVPTKPAPTIFGPFTDPKLLRKGMAVLRKIFLWRDCSDSKFNYYKKRKKPCLEYYIKNCSAPCVYSVESGKASAKQFNRVKFINENDYQLNIKQFIKFLEGKKKNIIKDLKKKMKKLAQEKEFEKAAIIRDKVKSLEHIKLNLKSQISPLRADKTITKNSKLKNIIFVLNKELGYNLKSKKDFRIEFYDISNIAGKEAVGSMIVWQDGDFAKDQYRKFKIKTVKEISDTDMMKEVLLRRIKYLKDLKNPNYPKDPDLIILDGGKGQLGVIYNLFLGKDIDIPLIALAKKKEEVWGIKELKVKFKNKEHSFKKINIEKNSPEGYFLQRLRDEAHRFALSYHRKLREKKMDESLLDKIAGIGKVRRKKLLTRFGSVNGIIRAKEEDITKVVGKKLARKIKNYDQYRKNATAYSTQN